jgi:mono/diheme cytochrome c family protein
MRNLRLFALFAVPLLYASLASAQEGETIYKSKCAACHGPTAEGKIGPSLKTTKLSEDDVVLLLGKGDEARKMPHKKPTSSLTDDQIKAVAHYIKSLK